MRCIRRPLKKYSGSPYERRGRETSVVLLILVAALTACDGGLGPDTVAAAGDFRLEVEDAAQILAPVSALPNDPGVAETTLDFWIDYTLLAWAVNDEGALQGLDISSILLQELDRRLVLQLREQVIQVDTVITDEELAAAFDEQRPGEEIRASHILLSMAAGANEAQQDSIRALAADIRDRARAGEDFASLAEEYSEDPGSAAEGGNLGFFGRGMMVPPFEEAAFALELGEVSDVTESAFGLHIILLEERRSPTLPDIAEQYRVQLQTERMMVAESTYLAEVEGPANVQIADNAITLVRQIADSPEDRLSGSDASSLLTSWEGGEFPAEEFREFLIGQPGEIRQQIAVAQDAQLESMLRDLTRDRLLVSEAEESGVELTAEQEEAVVTEVLNQYVMIADFLGVDSLEVSEGGTLSETVSDEVRGLMERLVASEQDILPLGALALPLRAEYGYQVAEDAAQRIVTRVSELRAAGADQIPLGAPPPGVAPPPAPAAEPPVEADPNP